LFQAQPRSVPTQTKAWNSRWIYYQANKPKKRSKDHGNLKIQSFYQNRSNRATYGKIGQSTGPIVSKQSSTNQDVIYMIQGFQNTHPTVQKSLPLYFPTPASIGSAGSSFTATYHIGMFSQKEALKTNGSIASTTAF